MSKLVQALKEKYKTPDAALRALGLDSSLLDGDTSAPVKNSGEGRLMETLIMRKTTLSRKAAMAKGAIAVCLSPRLAQDAQVDLIPLLDGVTHENWKASKAKIIAGLRKLSVAKFKDKPAMDAGVQDVMKLLDSLDNEQLGDKPQPASSAVADSEPDADLEGVTDPRGTGMDDPSEAIRAILQGKVDDATLEQVLQCLGGGADDASPDVADGEASQQTEALMKRMKKNPADGGEGQDQDMGTVKEPAERGTYQGNAKKPLSPPGVSQAAMDAAIIKAKKETREQLRDLAEAQKIVQPLIGEVDVMAMDSAADVYALALEHHGIDVEGVHPSAYKAMVQLLAAPGAEAPSAQKRKVNMAQDGAKGKTFAELFPKAGKVQHL